MAELLVGDLLSLVRARSSEAEASTALDLVLDGDADALRRLLLQAASSVAAVRVNARSPTSGRALLHDACAEGHLEIAKLLLEKTDADIMLRTMLGRCTPLHLAVTNNHRPVVFLLLSYGADPLCRDRSGSSPMHYVKSISVAKLLIQYGGLVLDYNSKRKNALESVLMIAENGDPEDDDPIRREFQKFLKRQAESEYKAKLERLRQSRKAAAQTLARKDGRPPERKPRKRLSNLKK
ncbi:hypothetical protein PybrP1_012543 [[Pythium] brassicae (nom. inval.)]|nr:hypothetical protein PybrP1_012543 [[Pythium] brassicae (nom. inval.)]